MKEPQRYIAFLRAINVGGHTVKMDHLRKLFEALGFAKVETFIASGNVIFEAASTNPQELEGDIGRHLRQALGYDVVTFLRSSSELAAITRYQPFPAPELEGHSLYVAFLPSPPSRDAQEKLKTFQTAVDEFHVCPPDGREVYWLCRKKFSESEFSGARLEKTIGLPATIRNITTVRKLAAKYP